ncbi:FecR domain-containing protein [Chitinophaga sp. XS-30]|uniref:FecR domain-containing protein n=1 Tax=Chitinophaga sp. XS-30 TaxID=2604421 RepID=UPI0011DD5074|nr:FecR domain-containing protein [Chitinophaga sp. XS-30]QEH40618.1 DUF4974 domain-containing protein [Chitinophaga sp. XS-30]
MNEEEIIALLHRYDNGACTPEEIAIIESIQLRRFSKEGAVSYGERREQVRLALMANIEAEAAAGRRSGMMRFARIAAAAVLVLTVTTGLYFLLKDRPEANEALVSVKPIEDVAPGGNRAYLTLADGRQIALDSIDNGTLAQQAGMVISKTAEGEVVYTPSKTSPHIPITENPIFNTITTPKGGQYQVVLPDGSKVWLNAASSLTFPATFDGMTSRSVNLTGEGYFEVTHQNKKPFLVKSITQTVQVLGTHFNINSYQDEEAVRTTLLEGAVRIFSTKLNLSKTLSPGQTATHQNERITIEAADETAVAWKNGMLEFKQADLKSILRQVARWYDLTIVYQGAASTEKFTGGISRESNLSELLYILEGMGINFRIERRENENFLIVKN